MNKKLHQLAKQLHERNMTPADLCNKKNLKRNYVFLLAYTYYLMSLNNQNTKKQYRAVIDHFTRFMANIRKTTPLDAIGIDVNLWREDLIRTGGVGGAPPSKNLTRYEPHEKTSVHNKVSILSAFFKFLQKPGLDGSPPLMKYNPVNALLDRFKIEKYGRSKKISLDALRSILEVIDIKTIKGLRDYTLIYGFFLTGRRNSEWVTLQWKQINFNTDPITYSFIRKGQKDTIDEVPDELLSVLITYVTKRWGEDFLDTIDGETCLFTAMPGRGGTRQIIDPNQSLTERSMLRIIKGYAKEAELDADKITVHSLRHLHAQSYLEAGASVEEVRGRMGHASLATTQRYLASMQTGKNRLASKLDAMLKQHQGQEDKPSDPDA